MTKHMINQCLICLSTVLLATMTHALPDIDYNVRLTELERELNLLKQQNRNQRLIAPISQSVFNPEIGVILQSQYFHGSADSGKIAGFFTGHHSERPDNGFNLQHTEFVLSTPIDPRFYGETIFAIDDHDGETEIDLETALIRTVPSDFIPDGLTITAGRAFWEFGYLNEHHIHSDDFSDRPLPYRTFLDGSYNDDGVQVSYILPTKRYIALSTGAFNGNDGPFNIDHDGDGPTVWSAGLRIGGDYSPMSSWRVGASLLSGSATERVSEDSPSFTGYVDLYSIDWRYVWTSFGREFVIQSEYLYREESGHYTTTNDAGEENTPVAINSASQGWYTQAVYQFQPQWRVGLRYAMMLPDDVPVGLQDTGLNADGHQPKDYSVMLAWSGSEFSRIRLQYSQIHGYAGHIDDQISLQYSMSLGAHRVHNY